MATLMSGPSVFAADGLIFILAYLFGIWLTWRAVGILRWDKFTVDPYGQQARLLRFVMAMLGGLVVGLSAVFYVLAVQFLRLLT